MTGSSKKFPEALCPHQLLMVASKIQTLIEGGRRDSKGPHGANDEVFEEDDVDGVAMTFDAAVTRTPFLGSDGIENNDDDRGL